MINKQLPFLLTVMVFLTIIQLSSDAQADYQIPKGIPDPSQYFGAMDPIDDPAPLVDSNGICAVCPNWPDSESSGCYYIDNTAPNNTDSENTYGSPDKPRRTIPEGELNAGDFVYIAGGGTYTASGVFDWHGIGTDTNPIWITGDPDDPPTLNDSFVIGNNGNASYIVLQYFMMVGNTYNSFNIQPGTNGDTADHIVLRHFSMTGTQEAANYSALLVGWSQNNDTHPDSSVTYTVIYDGNISGFGDKSSTDEAGIYNGYHTDFTWVLGNTITDVGADSIAGSHYADDNTKKTENYFIGDNTLFGNGENGIDLKAVRNTIISENTIHGPFTREQGWGIVLHYGASPSTTVKNAWVIFNKIYHVSGGIYTSGSVGADDLNIIGNLIYDVDADYAVTPDPQNGYCAFVGGGDGRFRIVDNTFYGYDSGLLIYDLDGSDDLSIHGNIFADRNTTDGVEVNVGTDETKVGLDYNQFYPAIEDPVFNWNGSERTLSYLQTTASECSNCDSRSPLLSNPPVQFELDSNSVCRNTNIEGPEGDSAYTAFYNQFSIDIKFGINGASRNTDGQWDRGAFEMGISAPMNLRLISTE